MKTRRDLPYLTYHTPDAVRIVNPYRAPPAGGATDPNFASVVLLVHFDGTDAATAATDFSGSAHTLTFNNQAQLDTDFKKFGTASLLLDGNADSVSMVDHADWDLGTGAFTIEAWIRPAGSGDSQQSIFCRSSGSFDLGDYQFRIHRDDGTLSLRGATTHSSSSGVVVYDGSWQHVAVTRDGSSTLRLFHNGTEVLETALVLTDFSSAKAVAIGGRPSSTSDDFNGHIDEVRVTKGVARYTDSFTVPSAAFPDS